jgi:hypothetical protein
MERSPESIDREPDKERPRNNTANENSVAVDSTPADNFFSPINHGFYAKQPYTPLNKTNRSIRLLQVSKDTATGNRIYTLTEERSLNEGSLFTNACNTYTAISYCAGDPKDTRELLINGIKFNAFANLARAIHETCHYLETAYNKTEYLLWTDQICINQSDPGERSHQVGMMFDVYKNAREVAVCLSTAGNIEGNGACDWMSRMIEDLPVEAVNPLGGFGVWSTCFSWEPDHVEIEPHEKEAYAIVEEIKQRVQTSTRDAHFLRGLLSTLDG